MSMASTVTLGAVLPCACETFILSHFTSEQTNGSEHSSDEYAMATVIMC